MKIQALTSSLLLSYAALTAADESKLESARKWEGSWILTPDADSDPLCCFYKPRISISSSYGRYNHIYSQYADGQGCQILRESREVMNQDPINNHELNAAQVLEWDEYVKGSSFASLKLTRTSDNTATFKNIIRGKICMGKLVKEEKFDWTGVWEVKPETPRKEGSCYPSKPFTITTKENKWNVQSAWEDSPGCKALKLTGEFEKQVTVEENKFYFTFSIPTGKTRKATVELMRWQDDKVLDYKINVDTKKDFLGVANLKSKEIPSDPVPEPEDPKPTKPATPPVDSNPKPAEPQPSNPPVDSNPKPAEPQPSNPQPANPKPIDQNPNNQTPSQQPTPANPSKPTDPATPGNPPTKQGPNWKLIVPIVVIILIILIVVAVFFYKRNKAAQLRQYLVANDGLHA